MMFFHLFTFISTVIGVCQALPGTPPTTDAVTLTEALPERHFSIYPLPITCEEKINAKATALAVNVGSATSNFISDSNWGTIHMNYEYGAIYCKEASTGAFAVYGDIYLKWAAQNGNYGYPITDETATTDNAGNAIQYNIFSDGTNNMAIYSTSMYGSCLIHGNIYGTWLSIGDVKSSIGYPITDETSSGSSGGRYNDFSNGMIYWHSGTSWVHVGSIPDSIPFSTGPIGIDGATATTTLTFDINGNVRWLSTGNPNDYGDYAAWEIGIMMVNADGTAISLYQGSGGDPSAFYYIDVVAQSSLISENWRAWLVSTYWKWRADDKFNEASLMFEVLQDVQTGYPSVLEATSILG